RSRRGHRRRGWTRAVAAPRRGRRPRPAGGRVVPLGAARRPLRVRRLRASRPRAKPSGGGGLVAHRVLLAGSHDASGARLGAPLPVDRQGHARLFPHAPAARASGLARGDRLRRLARDDVRAPGAVRGGPDPQDRDPVAPARQPVHGLRRAGLGSRRRPRVSTITSESRPTLVAELTYRCPLRCAYCSNPTDWAGHADALTTDDWLRVFREAEALGVVQLNLTGGEPLLRDDLEPLVEGARRLDLYTNLITSGIPLTRARLAGLKALGLDNVQVSIQDVTPTASDRIAGTRAFERKLEVARWVKELGFPLTLNVVLHRENLDRVADVIALAESLDADRLELANT